MICQLRPALIPSPAFAEHKIRLSNLRKLIFGAGRKKKKSKRDADDNEHKSEEDAKKNTDSHNDSSVDEAENDNSAQTKTSARGHGRIPHTASEKPQGSGRMSPANPLRNGHLRNLPIPLTSNRIILKLLSVWIQQY